MARHEEGSDGVRAISALGEPSRRALYDAVTHHGDWVSRDQAAEATGLERGAAAHHLDRLAAEGLLEVDYQRLTGRAGPGAGRPAKLYRRSPRSFGVSLPPRDYRLAGKLLARAVDQSRHSGTSIVSALAAEASAEGQRWAELIRSSLRGRKGRGSARAALVDTLEEQGFEPVVTEGGAVTLRNCPFDYLASEHTELICNMNRHLIGAAVDAVSTADLEAHLEPQPGQCCVHLVPRRPTGSSGDS